MVSTLDIQNERSGFESWPEYKWVSANCQGNLTICWRITCNRPASHPGGVAKTRICYVKPGVGSILSGVRVNEGIAIVVSLVRSHCFISFLL